MPISLPPGVDTSSEASNAWRAGVEATQSWWRDRVINMAGVLAGGERGFLSCRRNGKCEREPQASLELLIEKVSTFECRAEDSTTPVHVPASELLILLAELLRTPDFQPIHIKRKELIRLADGLRRMQLSAREACDTIDRLGKLTYSTIDKAELGTALTLLCSIRDHMKEILR